MKTYAELEFEERMRQSSRSPQRRNVTWWIIAGAWLLGAAAWGYLMYNGDPLPGYDPRIDSEMGPDRY